MIVLDIFKLAFLLILELMLLILWIPHKIYCAIHSFIYEPKKNDTKKAAKKSSNNSSKVLDVKKLKYENNISNKKGKK